MSAASTSVDIKISCDPVLRARGANIGSIRINGADKDNIWLSLRDWRSRNQKASTHLTYREAIEMALALLYFAGEKPEGKPEVYTGVKHYMTFNIELSGNLFAVFGDREGYRKLLHEALDRRFNDAVPKDE